MRAGEIETITQLWLSVVVAVYTNSSEARCPWTVFQEKHFNEKTLQET